jgi:hypothetical protein
MTEWARMTLKGKGDTLDKYNTRDWLRAGVDRAGLAAQPFEAFNIMDRLAHGRLSKAAGLHQGSRYYFSGLIGTIGGPSIGVAEDVFGAVDDLTEQGHVTKGEFQSMRRLLPYQNIFYYDWLLRRGVESLDLPEKNVKTSSAEGQ